jgi:signal transduction histidine kinase/CheY-like chemotaxis protein
VTAAATAAANHTAIEQELFLLGYRNLRTHVFGQAGLSLLVAAGAWAAAPHVRVLVWIDCMLVFAVVLYAGVWIFKKQAGLRPAEPRTLRDWKRANFFLVSIAGVAWGSLGLLFVPDAQVNNLLVMTSFSGALAYSSVSNVYDLRAFFSSVLLGTAVLVSQIPAAFGEHALPVIGMCLLYLTVLSLVARNAHKTLIESIQLRLDNEHLAQTNAAHAARAEKANRDKSEFLAAASHDLRQPVHALMLLIEAYRQSDPVAGKHPLIQQISAAGQSVSALFNALMELSRLDSGTEKVSPEALDLPALLRTVLEPVRPQAERKGLRVRLFVAPALAHAVVLADRVLLGRVLGNLISNAVRYTARGGLLLSLRRAQGEPGLWLEVWDSGAGIAPQDQERIFDPYVQIGNRERDRTKGLGLGLAIVRHASALLGLRLSLRSRLQRGSCFRLHIPAALVVDQVASTEGADAKLAQRLSKSVLVGRRLLHIDDDPMVLQAMQALLGSWQLDLRSAQVGDAAAVLQVCGPDWVPECIISDFRLPGPLNGIQLLDVLLERFPLAVGLLQTGELAEDVQLAAEESGYLIAFKPVAPDVLAYTLCAVLERRSEERPT